MGLNEQAKSLIERFTSDVNWFGVNMIFTAPDANGGQVLNVTGLSTKHHLGVNLETGTAINSKTASVSVSEKFFSDANYPLRNPEGIVAMRGHLVDVADSTGNTERFIVEQWFPDEKIGLIVFILGTYKSNA